MVGVVVRDEDLAQFDEANGRLQQLALRALCAVDEQALAAPADEERRRRAEQGVGIDPDVPRNTRSKSTRRL